MFVALRLLRLGFSFSIHQVVRGSDSHFSKARHSLTSFLVHSAAIALSTRPMAQLRRPERNTLSRAAQVERAWLEAARNGDVDQMKVLRKQHPTWLNLNRVRKSSIHSLAHLLRGLDLPFAVRQKVDDGVPQDTPGDSDRSRVSRTPGFCSWDGFHLSTIGASALHTATWHGNDRIVAYLLEEGQHPDTQDGTGMTAVMLTLMHHNLQATRCILHDREAIQRNLVTDVRSATRRLRPLILCASCNAIVTNELCHLLNVVPHLQCRKEDDERLHRTLRRIQLFLRHNGDVDTPCHHGKTALHHATTDETYEVARLLISNGATIDVQDEEGKSPLYHCIHSTSLLVADLLLQHGANIHLPGNDGVTPLQLVIRTHDVGMLHVVLNHHQLVPTDKGEPFAGHVLMVAVDTGALPVVKFLLDEEYVSVDYQNGTGETAMHRALLQHRDAVTELLRAVDDRASAAVLRTRFDESCLHYAARYSNPAELQRLLGFCRQQGESVGEEGLAALLNSVNAAGSTALFLAATSQSDSLGDRTAKTRLMLEAGAKLLGSSPFLETTSGGGSSTAIMVLSTEAQVCLRSWLSECAESRFDDVTKFCMEYLAIIYSLHHPRLQVNHEVLGVMLSTGQAVDTACLLLLLPFDRRASMALLELVGAFGRQQGHALVLALYEELAAAWTGLVA
ncbi:hypothetical protein PHYPSEUDO_008558 [Phytophthora pseudosyringae]|uniref:Ankyrin repeat protein n=1 Tax=Phytophthora pseudosyringae TaxID=221518 RepID=A0A8T1VH39_9STRA|nr:hypothetical protein PHYPSEUDO_008558 [Phytophthora pseudosyringae]